MHADPENLRQPEKSIALYLLTGRCGIDAKAVAMTRRNYLLLATASKIEFGAEMRSHRGVLLSAGWASVSTLESVRTVLHLQRVLKVHTAAESSIAIQNQVEVERGEKQ
jgi:hypothetical protein